MSNSTDKISSQALMFSIASYYQGTGILASFVAAVTKQETWIVAITGSLLSLVYAFIYIALANKFPGMTFVQINEAVFGKIAGKILSIIFIFYCFSLSFLDSHIMGSFIVGNLMPETPMAVVLIIFILICGYAAKKGVDVLTKYGAILLIINISLFFITSLLLINKIKISNFFPIFNLPLKNYIQGTHTLSTVLPSGNLIFLMFMPNLNNKQNVKKPFLAGTAIGALALILLSIRDISVLGSNISIVSNPPYEAIRLIDVADIFTRMEVIYALELIMLLFFQISILIYATAKGIEQLFNLSSYKILVPLVSGLTVCFSLIAFDSGMEHIYWGINYSASYSWLISILLPFITLITAWIKSLILKKKSNSLPLNINKKGISTNE